MIRGWRLGKRGFTVEGVEDGKGGGESEKGEDEERDASFGLVRDVRIGTGLSAGLNLLRGSVTTRMLSYLIDYVSSLFEFNCSGERQH